ncbi:hypothetical protein [Phenylobacterium sp.]|uniref:hypothetical protein n=1 Tax=Phenylobacterium sp. TaxID=1871053 RepID=UPI0012295E2C|nr:hypothetical protein [Phenylobacterium sp.]THD58878.1 MAG: hypothetical protein E8A49_17970 [Phenylobacterium sp.]
MKRFCLSLALAAIALAVPAAQADADTQATPQAGETAPAAKPPAGANLSGVTIVAPQNDPLVDAASQYVRSHLPVSTFTEQYPRFHEPICVKVQGLPAEFNAFVAKRVVDLAASVNARVASSSDCRANIHVIFDPEPQALMSDIARRRDILLGFYWNDRQLKQMSTFNRTIGSWYVTRTLDQFDISRLEQHDPSAYLDPPKGRAGSRLGSDMRSDLMHTLIVADSKKVADAKIGAVADYIAVLALAKWQGVEQCNTMPTILNLMADGCETDQVPDTATPADIGLLKGLYAVADRVSGSQQRMAIADRIESEMKKAAEDGGSR